MVEEAIQEVMGQVRALADSEKQCAQRQKKLAKINMEYEILKSGDLETDEVRSPKQMHDTLLDLEG